MSRELKLGGRSRFTTWTTLPQFGSYDVVAWNHARGSKEAFEATSLLLDKFPTIKTIFFIGTCGANLDSGHGKELRIGDVVVPGFIGSETAERRAWIPQPKDLLREVENNIVKDCDRRGPKQNPNLWSSAIRCLTQKPFVDKSKMPEELVTIKTEGILLTTKKPWNANEGKTHRNIDYVDQEDFEFARAAQEAQRDFLVIRGVSSYLDRDDRLDKGRLTPFKDRKNQLRAATNAAAVCGLLMGMIGRTGFVSPDMIKARQAEYDPLGSMKWPGNDSGLPLAIPLVFLRPKLKRWSKHWPPKSFLIALLETELTLQRGKGPNLSVQIPDNPICIYNNLGKEFLYSIPGKKYTSLISALSLYQADESREVAVSLEGSPLRWASGGGFAVVRYARRYWVPLFYRDKPPIGWNIPNGASESEEEWSATGLESLSNREFMEELILIAQYLKKGTPNCSQVLLNIPSTGEHWRKQALKFTRLSLGLRKKAGLSISRPTGIAPGRPGTLERLKGVADVQITRAYDVHVNRESAPHSYLFNVNPIEHGIETIRLFQIDMDEAGAKYILNGEVRENGAELVRLPVILLSLDYLVQNKEVLERLKPLAEGESAECKVLPPPLVGKTAGPDIDYSNANFIFFDFDIDSVARPLKSQFLKVVREGRIDDARLRTLCPATWRTIEECIEGHLFPKTTLQGDVQKGEKS